jgi:hypothetical protein
MAPALERSEGTFAPSPRFLHAGLSNVEHLPQEAPMLSAHTLLLSTMVVCACAPSAITTTHQPVPQPGSIVRYATLGDSTQLQRASVVSIDASRLVAVRDKPVASGRWMVDSVPCDSIAGFQVRIGDQWALAAVPGPALPPAPAPVSLAPADLILVPVARAPDR